MKRSGIHVVNRRGGRRKGYKPEAQKAERRGGLNTRDAVSLRVVARTALEKRLEVADGPETPAESRQLDRVIDAFAERRALTQVNMGGADVAGG